MVLKIYGIYPKSLNRILMFQDRPQGSRVPKTPEDPVEGPETFCLLWGSLVRSQVGLEGLSLWSLVGNLVKRPLGFSTQGSM